jgi:hypothetical protein
LPINQPTAAWTRTLLSDSIQKALEDMPKKDFLGSITESNLNIIGYNETTFSKMPHLIEKNIITKPMKH